MPPPGREAGTARQLPRGSPYSVPSCMTVSPTRDEKEGMVVRYAWRDGDRYRLCCFNTE